MRTPVMFYVDLGEANIPSDLTYEAFRAFKYSTDFSELSYGLIRDGGIVSDQHRTYIRPHEESLLQELISINPGVLIVDCRFADLEKSVEFYTRHNIDFIMASNTAPNTVNSKKYNRILSLIDTAESLGVIPSFETTLSAKQLQLAANFLVSKRTSGESGVAYQEDLSPWEKLIL